MHRSTRLLSAALVACCVALTANPASSAETKADAGMQMPRPGPEMKAIAPIFGESSAHWKGKVEAGAMGPDSKEMTSHGKVACHSMLGGLWYACDVEDTYGSGDGAMTWKGHMIVGYDANAQAYRATCTDNMGAMTLFNGTLDGMRFSLETPNEIPMMGQMLKDRLTWDMTDRNAIKFSDEHQFGGGAWQLVESSTMLRTVTIKKGTGVHVTG